MPNGPSCRSLRSRTQVQNRRTDEDWTYAYGGLNRLLSAANTNTPALSQTFTYDIAGNITSNSAGGAYTYPSQGASATRPHAAQTAGSWSFSYDDNGNQTERAVALTPDRTITWDADNRPSLVAG